MIEVKKIAFKYGSSSDLIFEDYSFEVRPGEILAILGPNGQGKTTLIKCLLDLLPLSGGRVHFNGHKSYVPQSALTPFDYEVREMVVMGCNRGRGLFARIKKEDYLDADVALEKVGMSKFASCAGRNLT